jgi:hypothetical protein
MTFLAIKKNRYSQMHGLSVYHLLVLEPQVHVYFPDLTQVFLIDILVCHSSFSNNN